MMADNEKPVDVQVRELMESWNPPPTDDYQSLVVGLPVPEGDTRATNAARLPAATHGRNPASDKVDAERMGAYSDDGDDEDDDEVVSYDDMTKKELQDEIDRRNAERDEDDHLSKSGNKAELMARLEEDDEAEDDDSEE